MGPIKTCPACKLVTEPADLVRVQHVTRGGVGPVLTHVLKHHRASPWTYGLHVTVSSHYARRQLRPLARLIRVANHKLEKVWSSCQINESMATLFYSTSWLASPSSSVLLRLLSHPNSNLCRTATPRAALLSRKCRKDGISQWLKTA
jgi:hypothetical protein